MQRKKKNDQHILYPSKPNTITTGEKNMNEEESQHTRIDVSKAIETAYWFGMVDGLRDTYRVVFKEPKGTDKLNTALTETLDRVMELANLDQKYVDFVIPELYKHNDLTSMKQTLWSTVLLGLPEFRKEIVYNKHMGNVEGQLKTDIEKLIKTMGSLEK